MLLETLDIKKNDVLIYSQNYFDFQNNFKIIYKDDPNKKHRKISFSEVREYVNLYVPKNLIVYRILTNISSFNLSASEYGLFTMINNEIELIYLDPIFAIKELELFASKLKINNLRFIVQQVGLSTLNKQGKMVNYAEIYHIDLEALEAKSQNDKVFADALLYESNTKQTIEKPVIKKRMEVIGSISEKNEKPFYLKSNAAVDLSKIQEDHSYEYKKMAKFSLLDKPSIESTNSTPQKITAIENSNSSESFVDIFKSSGSFKEYLESRANKKVILKIDQ